MRESFVQINGKKLKLYTFNSVVVGSGAAGLNAAVQLAKHGIKDVAIVTEGLMKGTSRNAGSDKQTYYKLTLAGSMPDSVRDMARTLFDGGSMDGDIALVEAALSTRAFFHLVEVGVSFPHNTYGEYVGYKTDHDPRQRATSLGPLTSRVMCEKLCEEVKRHGVAVFDGYQVIALLYKNEGKEKRIVGVLALDLNNLSNLRESYVLFNTGSVVYATGGPAGVFFDHAVYPESQLGSTGIALEIGAIARNLTEWQFGIASVGFRWNLSGTYQQVIPRYVSTDQNGEDEKEFLNDHFPDPGKMLTAIFLKGYQWPFDVRKIENYGSSLIDLLVYYESVIKGRRVWLDFTRNPQYGSKNGELDFSLLSREAYTYLKNSGALFGTPIERLKKMNLPAIEIYREHGIDLEKDYVEIKVCAQHNNGGLKGNIWWESNIKGFFPIGEVNGSHGVYRPGGSALNSGQVGGIRAAQYISRNYGNPPLSPDEFLKTTFEQIQKKIALGESFLRSLSGQSNVQSFYKDIGKRMAASAGILREKSMARAGAEEARSLLSRLPETIRIASLYELKDAFRLYDLLLTQYVYLKAVEDYIDEGGGSRGSYLVHDTEGVLQYETLPETFRHRPCPSKFRELIQEVWLDKDRNFHSRWVKVKPIPEKEDWFETTWERYRNGEIFKVDDIQNEEQEVP